MEAALLLLLPISLLFVMAVAVFFWWATFAGQFDDSEAGGKSIFRDDDTPDDG